MSGGLPYPVSHNRAPYHASDTPPSYSAGPHNPSYSYPSYHARSPSFDANHGRPDAAVASSSLSGMFQHAEHDQPQHYPRSGHSVDPFAHQQGPAHHRDQSWDYTQSIPEVPRARFDHPGLPMSLTRDYQSSMSHAPSVVTPSQGHNASTAPPNTSSRSVPSGASAGRSRREKPRLELAPDQPLTTQGKPRTRVYVACVQCRNRKIRCDGAKPICHNCSRRTENPHICSYDSAPKRRGPDRIPGARQRSAASSGEKPPRRRRRPQTGDMHEQPFMSPQSASQSPVEPKTASFSPSAPSFMGDGAPSRSENLSIIQEVGQYSRHRQGLHDPGRPAVPGGASGHYVQHHDLTISHTPAAAYEAYPLGSPLPDAVPVGYVVGAQGAQGLPLPHPSEPETKYGVVDGEHDSQEDRKYSEGPANIASEPGLQFTRETWWEALLVLYARDDGGGRGVSYDTPLTIPPGMREDTTQSIAADLRAIFRVSPHWLNFINLPRFFGSLLDPQARHSMQPSLILGALALATFFRSHENGLGERGRQRALKLRDHAQSALEASLSTQWIDHSLVQAAWLLAFFEICAHPLHSTTRVRSSMGLLDSLLRTMRLLSLDEADPRASVFTSAVPVVPSDLLSTLPATLFKHHPVHQHIRSNPSDPAPSTLQWHSSGSLHQALDSPDVQSNPTLISPLTHLSTPRILHPHSRAQSPATQSKCNCMTFTLGHSWPMVKEFAPLWDTTPTWQSEWTESEIRKEECRRIVWSSVMLSAGHSSYTAASSNIQTQQLFLMDTRNYALLFPGESLTSVDDSPTIPPPGKGSVWALYMRAMLMWNSCILMRADSSLSDADKAHFALAAWTELDVIEEALDRHTCGIERSFLFQGREILFNSRMCIAYEFQRCLPQPTAHANLLFYRRKAEEWLMRQASLAKRMVNAGLHSVTGLPAADLARRPFLLFWFMSQIERALTLWSYDQSLALALDVAKALSKPVEYLMTLWPCPEQRRRWEELQEKLNNSCFAASHSSVVAGPPTTQEMPSVPTQR